MGTVVRTPEKRFTSNNIPITFFSINIGKNEEPSLLRVIAKGKLAETTADTLKKDKIVIVEGRLQSTTVKDNKGNEQKAMELDARSVEIVSEAAVAGPEYQDSFADLDVESVNTDELIGEDEIPF